ncbi:hypothetical protein HYV82_06055 [Candidatus Woesearchaeota archaeon]|nr:hypothetical protein [Candidatus Woesearchaeota archaeon]
MISGGRLPECEGLSTDECREKMKGRDGQRREGEGGGQEAGRGGFPSPPAQFPNAQQMPQECEGISIEECREKMKGKAEGGKEMGREGSGGSNSGRREGSEGFPRSDFPKAGFPKGGMPGNIPNTQGMPTMPQNIPQDSPRMPDISTDSGQMPSAPSISDSGSEGSMPPQG